MSEAMRILRSRSGQHTGGWRERRASPSAPNLGQSAQAEESLRKAETLLDTVLVASPDNRLALFTAAQVAHDRMILADVAQRDDDALVMAGRAAGRLETFLQRVGASEPERRDVANAFSNIGLFHKNAHRHDDAVRHCRRAIDICRSLPSGQIQHSQALSIMADSLRLSGDLEGALRAISEAVTTLEGAASLSEAARLSGFINVLSRQGVMLGEDGGVNAGRPDEAIAVLQRAIDFAETWAAADRNETSSRIRLASAGRELGNILRHRSPVDALRIYDHARRRLGEIASNVPARRREADPGGLGGRGPTVESQGGRPGAHRDSPSPVTRDQVVSRRPDQPGRRCGRGVARACRPSRRHW